MIFGGHILFSAESEGFEPPVQLPVHRISSAAIRPLWQLSLGRRLRVQM